MRDHVSTNLVYQLTLPSPRPICGMRSIIGQFGLSAYKIIGSFGIGTYSGANQKQNKMANSYG